jgi:putative peptide zinc metalloprotease protein
MVVGPQQAGSSPADEEVAHRTVPALVVGTELIGQYQGSGHREPPYLARRADGQVLQLSPLLYRVAAGLDGSSSYQRLAERLSDESGRGITAAQVFFLVENRLRRAGIVAGDPASGPPEAAPMGRDRLLALKFRVALVPEHVVAVIARLFQPLFWPPVVVLAVAGFVFADVWLAVHGGADQILAGAQELLGRPEQILLVLGLLIVAGMFHECGHVAACRYGGAQPGAMGVGIYLVWPAMYSTVTDSYRLSRGGRLRTDLGGIYFNVIAMLVMIAAYAQTGLPWLLAALLTWQATTIWQFLPSIRLDGYYILSDLVGVPDLFDRMGPVLRSLVPGRPPHPRVRELKPWVRVVITAWVVLVIPFLAYWIILFLVLAPHVLPGMWDALVFQAHVIGGSIRTGETAGAMVGVLRIFLLVLPWVGMAMVLTSLGRRPVRALRRWLARHS